MGKGEREVHGKGREEEGGEERERKGAMAMDPTKYGEKMMPVFIHLYYFEYKNIRPIASRLQRVKLLTSFKMILYYYYYYLEVSCESHLRK